MSEFETPGLPEQEVNEIIARLKLLPRVAAPTDFVEQVHARIARMDIEERQQSSAGRNARLRPNPGLRMFSNRRVAYGMGAAAVLAVGYLMVYPQFGARPSGDSSALMNQSGSGPSQQLSPVPASQMKITAATEDQVSPHETKLQPNKSVVDRRSAVPVNEESHIAKDAATTVVGTIVSATGSSASSSRQIPQDILNRPHSKSFPLVGGTLSTVGSGDPAGTSGIDLQDSHNSPAAGKPDSVGIIGGSPFLSFQALKRGLDSARVRDSLRRVQSNPKK